MRLVIVRHGNTDSNINHLLDTGHPGAPLNDTGLAQAAALAQRLAGEPIEAVFTSDLTRAIQTGAPLAELLGVPLYPMTGLREIFAGEHDMSPEWDPYVEVLISWGTDPSNALPGMENARDFLGRWEPVIDDIAARGYECVAIVSHGAALRTWVPYASQNLTPAMVSRWPMHNTAVMVLEGNPTDGWRALSWDGGELG